MAYKKNHEMNTGATISHFRVTTYRIDYAEKEASAIMAGFVSEKPLVPVAPVFAKLRLSGDRFVAILGKAALKASEEDVNAAIYRAFQSEPIICDAGPDFFKDAEAC